MAESLNLHDTAAIDGDDFCTAAPGHAVTLHTDWDAAYPADVGTCRCGAIFRVQHGGEGLAGTLKRSGQMQALIAAHGAEVTLRQRQWSKVCSVLRAEFGAVKFDAFLSRLELAGVAGHAVSLSAPTAFLRTFIMGHYIDRILAAWRTEDPAIARIIVSTRTMGPESKRKPERPAAAPVQRDCQPVQHGGQPVQAQRPAQKLDPALRLDNFVAYTGNRMAQAAVENAVAETRRNGQHEFNPIFIHGGCGLGKTHLLTGAVRDAAGLYLSCNSLAACNNIAAFKAMALDARDLIAIDDIQAVTTRAAQAALCQILDVMISEGRQVLLAASVMAAELRFLTGTRIGFCVGIGYPDQQARSSILRAMIAAKAARGHDSFARALNDRVIARIAAMEPGDGHMAVILDRLLAAFMADGLPPSVERAAQEIETVTAQITPAVPRVEEILRAVGRHYHIGRIDLLSVRRTKDVVWPRQVGMYLAKTLTLRSLPEIGRRFGGRDHTTVLHAVRKVTERITADAAIAAEIESVKAGMRADLAPAWTSGERSHD